MVHLYNDGSGWFSDWFVNKITITSSKQEETFDFPCYRWVVDDMVVFQGKGEPLQGVQLRTFAPIVSAHSYCVRLHAQIHMPRHAST